MRIPDWMVYVAALGAILYVVYANGSGPADAPEPPPLEAPGPSGPLLSPPSPFDEQILIQVENRRDGVGTAFAVSRDGRWLTARHVVEGCDEVGLIVGRGAYVPAARVDIDTDADLALLTTGRAPRPAPIDFDGPLRVGDLGFHVGYPQGRPGEATARLLARSRLVTRGARRAEEGVLAWAEIGRTRGLEGTLGGLSGGPVYDKNGRVRGVIVAESPRRGRIYTASPDSVAAFLSRSGVALDAGDPRSFTVDNYGEAADSVRRNLEVVQVTCDVFE